MDLVSKSALKLREIFTINNQQYFITFLNANFSVKLTCN